MSAQPLPFAFRGRVLTRPDTTVVDDIPCTVWPTGTRVTQAGLTYDHQGEAPVEFYDQLRESNVLLEVRGELYVIVDAQENIYLPHTALILRRSRPAGA